jgi:hypothetical protein
MERQRERGDGGQSASAATVEGFLSIAGPARPPSAVRRASQPHDDEEAKKRRLSARLKKLGMKCGRGLTQACVQSLVMRSEGTGKRAATHEQARSAFETCQRISAGRTRLCRRAVMNGASHTDLLRVDLARP